jgi:NADH:ubiquinone oxidoreductase subunit 6 (subunit J)
MDWLWAGLLAFSLAMAFLAVALGRNLTRSLTAGYVFLATLAGVLVLAGAGGLAWVVAIVAAVALAMLQVFGWMLVDVDRDHLPPTEATTRVARGLAFLLLGGGLAALAFWARGELVAAPEQMPAVSIAEIGAALFGALPAEATLLGLAVAASLLTTLLLLRDPGGEG